MQSLKYTKHTILETKAQFYLKKKGIEIMKVRNIQLNINIIYNDCKKLHITYEKSHTEYSKFTLNEFDYPDYVPF